MTTNLTFNNGLQVPIIGLGTWQSKPGEVANAVKLAIKAGYRHIDCAFVYGNESEIGEALKEIFENSDVKREDLFITSKLWNTFHHTEHVKGACEATLKGLGLDYIDLYLIHWPFAYQPGESMFPRNEAGEIIESDFDYLDTWRAMEELVDQGLTKSIGVSNFNISQLQRVLDNARIKPVVNQVEIHPKFSNNKLVDFCKANGIVPTAYSPLGNNSVPKHLTDKEWSLLDDARVKRIAAKYGKTEAQVLIRLPIERGICVIPKTVSEERIKSNFDVFDFALTEEEVSELTSFPDQERILKLSWNINHKYYPFHED